MIISLVTECIIGMVIFGNWKNSPISSLDFVVGQFIMKTSRGLLSLLACLVFSQVVSPVVTARSGMATFRD